MRPTLWVASTGILLALSSCLFSEDRISCRQDQDCPGATWCGGVERLEGPDCDHDPDLWTSHQIDEVCSLLYCIGEEESEFCGEEGNPCEDPNACVLAKGYDPNTGDEHHLHRCVNREHLRAGCDYIENPNPDGYPRPDGCDENSHACVLVFEMFRYEEDPPFRCVEWGLIPDIPW